MKSISLETLVPIQPKRTIHAPRTKIPPYHLSVVARNLTERKAQWEIERKNGLPAEESRPWVPPGPEDTRSSLIVRVNEAGTITAATSCGLAHGILPVDEGILSAQHGEIMLYDNALSRGALFSTSPEYNDLHTLRNTEYGILVVSSGTDSVFELSKDGKSVLWAWRAREHGFTENAYRKARAPELDIDHRKTFYNTWVRTTHVNSALPFDENTVLGTFFHQGIMCRIDKKSGGVTPVVPDLKRPHALRWSDDKLTFADTGRGIAYMGTLIGDTFEVEHTVQISTNWLQDAQYRDHMWILVDAEHAQIHFLNLSGELLAIDQFDTDWDFFEVSVETT